MSQTDLCCLMMWKSCGASVKQVGVLRPDGKSSLGVLTVNEDT